MKGVREFAQIGAVALGIDIGKSAIKAVELRRSGRGTELLRFSVVPTPEGSVEGGAILDRAAVARAVTSLRRKAGIRTRRAVISITGQNVLARMLRLPPIPDEEVKPAMKWEAEKHLPFPVDEAVLDAQIVREVTVDGRRQKEVLLAAAPEGLVLAYIETLEAAGLFVEAVELGALAMARALRQVAGQGTHALVNLGASSTDVAVARDGVPQLARSIPTGASQAAAALEELVTQLRRSLDFYRAQFPGARIDSIVLCGGGARLPHIDRHLTKEMDLPVTIGTPFSDIRPAAGLDEATMRENASQLTVATGLALRIVA